MANSGDSGRLRCVLESRMTVRWSLRLPFDMTIHYVYVQNAEHLCQRHSAVLAREDSRLRMASFQCSSVLSEAHVADLPVTVIINRNSCLRVTMPSSSSAINATTHTGLFKRLIICAPLRPYPLRSTVAWPVLRTFTIIVCTQDPVLELVWKGTAVSLYIFQYSLKSVTNT